jgi:phenylacetate-coenzyme A ligase PaaK-like adenylate-forming protein
MILKIVGVILIFVTVYIIFCYIGASILSHYYTEFEKDLLRNPQTEYKNTLQSAIANIPCYNITQGVPIITKKILKQESCINKHITPLLYTKKITTNTWSDHTENKASFLEMIVAFLQVSLFDNYALAVTTGGTSGNSFYYWYNRSDIGELFKSYFHCWKTFGWDPSQRVLIYYGHPSSGGSLLKYFSFCNVNMLIPRFHEGDIAESSIIELLGTLEKTRPLVLESMPNFIFRVAQYIYTNGIELTYKPRGISLSGDFLFQCQYDFIRRIFGPNTIVLMSYGTVEFGQVAQQHTIEDLYTYRIFESIAYIENIGDNLAITRYRYNNMPIIRYQIDDKGVVTPDHKFIKNLIGKNKSNIDLLFINNAVQSLHCPTIINIRIHSDTLILIVTSSIDNEYIHTLASITGYNVTTILCSPSSCPTYDNLVGKVTPILNSNITI